jgi:hypothetical protein
MSDPPRRRFMRPWKVIEHDESYEVQDAVGLPLASVYFENETIRQSSTRRLSKDEARRVPAMSGLPRSTDIVSVIADVRKVPIADLSGTSVLRAPDVA